MKKQNILIRLLCLLLAFVMIFSFSACNTDGEHDNTDDNSPSDGTGDTDEKDDSENPAPVGDLSGVTFTDATYQWDGKSHKIEVQGLPEGATVTYSPRNSMSGAGSRLITATVSMPGCEDRVLTATLTITTKPIEALPQMVKKIELPVGTYNIHRGIGSGDSNVSSLSKLKSNIKAMASDIKASGAEIVGLQEVEVNVDRSYNQNLLKLMADELGYKYYQFFPAFEFGGGQIGCGIISKYPIVEHKLEKLATRTDADTSGKHYEQRVLGRVKVNINNIDVNFFVTHLTYQTSNYTDGTKSTVERANALRVEQITQIVDILRTYENYIIVGDFNTGLWREGEYSQFQTIGGKAINWGADKVITMPDSTLADGGVNYDHIIHSTGEGGTNWSFTPPAVAVNNHSDHYYMYSTGSYYVKEIPES